MKPNIIHQKKIPEIYLSDIYYDPLQGHYGNPLPKDYDGCLLENKYRGKDVINLIMAIRAKNKGHLHSARIINGK